jgi:hypothetical protein
MEWRKIYRVSRVIWSCLHLCKLVCTYPTLFRVVCTHFKLIPLVCPIPRLSRVLYAWFMLNQVVCTYLKLLTRIQIHHERKPRLCCLRLPEQVKSRAYVELGCIQPCSFCLLFAGCSLIRGSVGCRSE